MHDKAMITALSRRRRRGRTVAFLLAAGAASTVLLVAAHDRASAATLPPSRHTAPVVLRTERSAAQTEASLATVTPAFGTIEAPLEPELPLLDVPSLDRPLGPAGPDTSVPSALAPPPPTVPAVLPVSTDVLPLTDSAEVAETAGAPRPLWLAAAARARWRTVASAAWLAARARRSGGFAADISWLTAADVEPVLAPLASRVDASTGAIGDAYGIDIALPDLPVPRPAPGGPTPSLPAAIAAPTSTGAGWSPDQGAATTPPVATSPAGRAAGRVITQALFGNGSDKRSLNGSRAPPLQEAH